jgi:hypothetical protein
VVEVRQITHRHGTKLLRRRPDKTQAQCAFEQFPRAKIRMIL